MRRAAAWIVAVCVGFAASEAHALPSTPLSASTLEQGKTLFAGFVGFPYLTIQAGHALAGPVDLSLVAQSAWANLQRVGASSRVRLGGSESSAVALRAGLDTWLGRPETTRWINVTGQQDVTGSLAFLYSWATPRGTVMTFDGGLLVVGTRHPPVKPLEGPPKAMAFGPNVSFRMSAEIPHRSGLLFAFSLGMDLHLSGFDETVAMPAFLVGVGYLL